MSDSVDGDNESLAKQWPGRNDYVNAGPLRRKQGRALIPHGGNDRIFTPDALAFDIVRHFRPCGDILEPSAGGNAFVRAVRRLGLYCDWCELDRGRDFFDCSAHYDYIIGNPPYSIFTRFLQHSLEVADNVVYLCPIPAWFQRARQRIINNAGFGCVEICHVPVPPPPWPPFGLSLGVAWLRRGWQGSPQFSKLPSRLWPATGDKMVSN
jgi:hypothetical protein